MARPRLPYRDVLPPGAEDRLTDDDRRELEAYRVDHERKRRLRAAGLDVPPFLQPVDDAAPGAALEADAFSSRTYSHVVRLAAVRFLQEALDAPVEVDAP